MGFLGFLGFLLLHTLCFENRWVFGVFGVFAASYFIVLRIGGFLLLHTLSFCELMGFLGFLLLHTLSF